MIVYHFDLWAVLGFAVQFVLPLVVGIVTTKVTSSRDQFLVLASLTAVVSVVTSALTAHDAHTAFDVVQALLTALAGLLVSVGTHFGIWKPTGLADLLLAFGRTASQSAVAAAPAVEDAPAAVASVPVPAPAPVAAEGVAAAAA